MVKNIIIVVILVLLYSQTTGLYAQDNKTTAYNKALQAVKLMYEDQIDEAIRLLEEAQLLDPGNYSYQYETAVAYYKKQEYSKAISILEKLLLRPDAIDLMYQLLGNSYSLSGNFTKAISTYEQGLRLFPSSGALYLERGNIEFHQKKYIDALSFFEKGIEVEPTFASNYYWSSIIYCNTDEEVWGMIYGEIFMNLERNSQRTKEISKLLYDTYTSEIKFKDDSSISISFSKNTPILPRENNLGKMPFGLFVYEMLLTLSVIGESEIDLSSLSRIRTKFIEEYFNKEFDKEYPNVLFEYQNTLKSLGHLEAYNHWLLMQGNFQDFELWVAKNSEKWDSFVEWFLENPLEINNENKLHSSHY